MNQAGCGEFNSPHLAVGLAMKQERYDATRRDEPGADFAEREFLQGVKNGTEQHESMYLDESEAALGAAKDERLREALIQRQERNILRIASRAKHRFVTKSDDEWSIALCAFSRAIDTYAPAKGGFLPYAEMLIKHSLIDAYRSQARRENEFAVPPEAFDGEMEGEGENPVLGAVAQLSLRVADTRLKDEITVLSAALKAFGFSFFDLTECSPSQQRTRSACAKAVQALCMRPEDLEALARTRKLPMRNLIRIDGISSKLLGRYRRYIIASVVILTGEYPILAEYIRNCGRGEDV